MQKFISAKSALIFGLVCWLIVSIACQPTATTNTNSNLVNTNVNISNSFNANSNAANTNSMTSTSVVETKEPEQYQATVTLKLEAMGDQQKTSLPTLSANVARSGADRRMEFNMPNGEKIVYLDQGGVNYLVLPNRKQYAELTKDALGFEVRQLMMPEQIIKQVQNVKGIQRVGEENVNGRSVIKYRYGAVTNTQTNAGQVATESFILVDKETGLPLHSETVSESQTSNVQGYKGLRFVTEMTNIKTEITPDLFAAPTGLQKIQAEEVKAQVNLIFNAVALLIGQAMKSAQPTANTATTPASSPNAVQ